MMKKSGLRMRTSSPPHEEVWSQHEEFFTPDEEVRTQHEEFFTADEEIHPIFEEFFVRDEEFFVRDEEFDRFLKNSSLAMKKSSLF
ncbi:MAG TPA: hypothetical protein VF618_11020 [Thermoanaerobaculia bacterium]